VKTIPVRLLEEADARRLVMLTFKNMKRLTFNAAFGMPPEQLKTMSPARSVSPSPWTICGEADGMQVKGAASRTEHTPTNMRGKMGKNWRNIGKYLVEAYQRNGELVYALLQ
jgi:hypothetical protein